MSSALGSPQLSVCNHRAKMSALDQKRTLIERVGMSALPPKADIGTQQRDVRFVPKCASQMQFYVMTSPKGGLASTTEVSTWRSGILQ